MGVDEAERCNEELSKSVREFQRAYKSIALGGELTKVNRAIADSLGNGIASNLFKKLKVATASANALKASQALTDSLGNDIASNLFKSLEEATASVKALEANSALCEFLEIAKAPAFSKILEDASATVEIMKSSTAFSETLGRGVLNNPQVDILPMSLTGAQDALSNFLSQPNSPGLSEVLSQSLAPLAETQLRISGLFTKSMALPDTGLVLSQSNGLIARALEDVETIYSAPKIRSQGFDSVFYPEVLRDIRQIGASIRSLLQETTEIAAATHNPLDMQQTWSRMLIPSSTVANYTRSLRSELEVTPDIAIEVLPPLSHREDQSEPLNLLLIELNPDLADKWRGSWEALEGSNPDGLSQAAFSYRELIRMVLDELVPEVELDRTEQGSKRKQQVRQFLQGSEGDFAYVMIVGLSKLYDFLSKPAHTNYRNKLAVQAALMAGDGLLLLLLSGRRDYDA